MLHMAKKYLTEKQENKYIWYNPKFWKDLAKKIKQKNEKLGIK